MNGFHRAKYLSCRYFSRHRLTQLTRWKKRFKNKLLQRFFFHGAFDWKWLQRVKYILMERMPREKLCAFILSKHLKEFLNVNEMFCFKRNRILFLMEKCFVLNTVSLLLWRVLLYFLFSLSKKWFTIELADRQQRTNFRQLIGYNEIDKNRAIDFTI